MGRQHARRVFELGQPGPLPYGNVEYDRAARAEFDRLTNLKKKV